MTNLTRLDLIRELKDYSPECARIFDYLIHYPSPERTLITKRLFYTVNHGWLGQFDAMRKSVSLPKNKLWRKILFGSLCFWLSIGLHGDEDQDEVYRAMWLAGAYLDEQGL